MKKIINSNSGCKNCINWHPDNTCQPFICQPFINKQVLNGLHNCLENDDLNYIYEKENEMKLTKAQKQDLKGAIKIIYDNGGFIRIYENGITHVYIPASKAKANRMFKYGQSVCNESDKYKHKYGVYMAIQDAFSSDKLMPIELIDILGSYNIN